MVYTQDIFLPSKRNFISISSNSSTVAVTPSFQPLTTTNLLSVSMKSESENISHSVVSLCCCWITKSCLTLCDLMDCSPPGSSVHGILQTRILEWVAISLFPSPRNLPDQGIEPRSPSLQALFTKWAIREARILVCIYGFAYSRFLI